MWETLWRNNKTDLDVCLYESTHPAYKGAQVADEKAASVWPWLSATLLLGFVAGISVKHP